MLSKLAILISMLFLLSPAWSQVEEGHVDFTVAPGVLQSGSIQVAYEWLEPSDFREKKIRVMDVHGISNKNNSNRIIASKVALLSQKSFDKLSYQIMNQKDFIYDMLGAKSVKNKGPNKWEVVTEAFLGKDIFFNFYFNEVSAAALPNEVVTYIRDEASAIPSNKRERFLILDMQDFSLLVRRNYSIVYMREISKSETMVVAGVVAGVDISKAWMYGGEGNLSSIVMKQTKSQVLSMTKKIKN